LLAAKVFRLFSNDNNNNFKSMSFKKKNEHFSLRNFLSFSLSLAPLNNKQKQKKIRFNSSCKMFNSITYLFKCWWLIKAVHSKRKNGEKGSTLLFVSCNVCIQPTVHIRHDQWQPFLFLALSLSRFFFSFVLNFFTSLYN